MQVAVHQFIESDTARIKTLAWSSTGWDTGVGVVAISTDDLSLVEEFRDAVAQVENDSQGFITMPKQMLLKKIRSYHLLRQAVFPVRNPEAYGNVGALQQLVRVL